MSAPERLGEHTLANVSRSTKDDDFHNYIVRAGCVPAGCSMVVEISRLAKKIGRQKMQAGHQIAVQQLRKSGGAQVAVRRGQIVETLEQTLTAPRSAPSSGMCPTRN